MLHIFKSLILSFMPILLIFNFINISNADSLNNDKTFIITAYYSPLPNQVKYNKWNYRAEKRLNGEWHTTASGKPVKVWTLAAPRTYPFWTKIYLEWFWIGSVEDRWSAIVPAWHRWHNYDRIDIWMWFWDEWRIRANIWGIKVVKWKFVSSTNEINLILGKDWLKKEEYRKNNLIWINDKIKTILSYSNLKVNPDNLDINEVKRLQELFKAINLYNWNIDWNYQNIKQDLIDFQKAIGLIKDNKDWWAWHFWEKTYTSLINYFELKNKQDFARKEEENNKSKYNKSLNIYIKKINFYIEEKSSGNLILKNKLKENIVHKFINLKKKTKEKNKIKDLEYIIKELSV